MQREELQMQNEVEIEKIRAERGIKLTQVWTGIGDQGNRDIERNVIYMPKFVKQEENFFLQSDKTGKLRAQDEDEWILLVQSTF